MKRICAALIAAFSILPAASCGSKNSSGHTMPELTGMSPEKAAGRYDFLDIQVTDEEYSTVPEGRISWQNVPAGKNVPTGKHVEVTVSLGEETAETYYDMPDLCGMDLNDAKTLYGGSFIIEIEELEESNFPENQIISQNIEPGTKISKGAVCKVHVSRIDDSNNHASVDNYIGMEQIEAIKLAEYRGFTVLTEPVNSYEPSGCVVDQNIDAGTKADKNTTILLYVSNGVPPVSNIPFHIPLPEDASGRFVMTFIIKNPDGTSYEENTDTLTLPNIKQVNHTIKGSGKDVFLTITVTNLADNSSAVAGTYRINFADSYVSVETEDIIAAFEEIGGFSKKK